RMYRQTGLGSIYYDRVAVGDSRINCIGGDITNPAVSMTTPANGATVSGSAVTLVATASDNVGVVGVQFLLDGVNLGAEDTTSPYSITWDTSSITTSAHTLS